MTELSIKLDTVRIQNRVSKQLNDDIERLVGNHFRMNVSTADLIREAVDDFLTRPSTQELIRNKIEASIDRHLEKVLGEVATTLVKKKVFTEILQSIAKQNEKSDEETN